MKLTHNYAAMQNIFNADWPFFANLGTVVEEKGKQYIFKDNGADILAIAHLDTVNKDNHFYPLKFRDETHIYSTRCDDRLGVYVLLWLFPIYGIKADLLLTTDEEIGMSTASLFKTEKKYNWMLQFDRRGEDAVTYSYNDKPWKEALAKSFTIGVGSSSDICKLEELGICGVNIGSGYHDEHNLKAFFVEEELSRQFGKFLNFYQVNKNIRYEHTIPPPLPVTARYYDYAWGDNWNDRFETFRNEKQDEDDWKGKVKPVTCPICSRSIVRNPSKLYWGCCADCEDDMIQCEDCLKYMAEREAVIINEDFFTCMTCARTYGEIEYYCESCEGYVPKLYHTTVGLLCHKCACEIYPESEVNKLSATQIFTVHDELEEPDGGTVSTGRTDSPDGQSDELRPNQLDPQ